MRLLFFRSAFLCAMTTLFLVNNVSRVGAERFSAKEEADKRPALAAVIRMAPPAPVFDESTRLAELASRRARVAQSIGEKGILILFSTEPRVYTNDVDYEYRQENNLYYLTNLKQKGATLVLTPSNGIVPAILFLPRRNPAAETWTGHMYSPDEARSLSGIREIWDNKEFEPFMAAMLSGRGSGEITAQEAARFFA